jgi:integrase
MPLTDPAVRKAEARPKPYKLADSGGMYLLVTPAGSKLWRWKYRVNGREKLLALGVYPVVTLTAARADCAKARQRLTQGIDESGERARAKREVVAKVAVASDTFRVVADAWMKTQDVAPITASKNRWILSHVMPTLGARPIGSITARDLLSVLRVIEATGKIETAQRAKVKVGQIFRFAVMEGRAPADITSSLRGMLKSPKVRHHAAITDPANMGALLRALDGFQGQLVTLAALRLAPLVFVRPGELRTAAWADFDLPGAIWRIPAEKMKMKAAHLVPLSLQAVSILNELRDLTGDDEFVFPGIRSARRPMSNNTINAALRRLGYSKDEMTGHGFRSMAATRLNEMGWRADAIERQLAHVESNKVREAYTSAAQYLDERTKMMQAWADYLDGLRVGGAAR